MASGFVECNMIDRFFCLSGRSSGAASRERERGRVAWVLKKNWHIWSALSDEDCDRLESSPETTIPPPSLKAARLSPVKSRPVWRKFCKHSVAGCDPVCDHGLGVFFSFRQQLEGILRRQAASGGVFCLRAGRYMEERMMKRSPFEVLDILVRAIYDVSWWWGGGDMPVSMSPRRPRGLAPRTRAGAGRANRDDRIDAAVFGPTSGIALRAFSASACSSR